MQRLYVGLNNTAVSLAIAFAVIIGGLTSAMAQDNSEALQLKQIALTEAQVKGYLKIGPKLNGMFDRIDQAGGQPDEKLSADLEALAKEGGFKTFNELETVVSNVTFVMSGINEEDGSFTEPAEMLKQELAETEADASIKAEEKKQLVASIKASIKETPKLKYPGNITVVKTHFKALVKLFEE